MSASKYIFNHYHATYTLFNTTSTTKMISARRSELAVIIANRKTFAVYSALRTSAKSCTTCSEVCIEGGPEPSPAVSDIVIGVVLVVIVEPSGGGCRRCITLVVCEGIYNTQSVKSKDIEWEKA